MEYSLGKALLMIPVLCLAELSYFLLKNRCSGHKGQVKLLHWIKSCSATVCSPTPEDCSSLEQTLADFKNEAMGLTEAMLMVLVKVSQH